MDRHLLGTQPVLEYLNRGPGRLPTSQPTLGRTPRVDGLEYAVVDDTGQHGLEELRSIQDWNIRYALESVEGVAEVATSADS